MADQRAASVAYVLFDPRSGADSHYIPQINGVNSQALPLPGREQRRALSAAYFEGMTRIWNGRLVRDLSNGSRRI